MISGGGGGGCRWSGTGGPHPHSMDEGLSADRDLSTVTSESRSESRSGPAYLVHHRSTAFRNESQIQRWTALGHFLKEISARLGCMWGDKVCRMHFRLDHVPIAKIHLSPAATMRRMFCEFCHSTLVQEGFVRRERLRHHTINVLYSRNNSIFGSFVTPGRQCAQVLCRRTRKFTDIGLCEKECAAHTGKSKLWQFRLGCPNHPTVVGGYRFSTHTEK